MVSRIDWRNCLAVWALFAAGSSATTWVVNVGYDAKGAPCTTPASCSLPGALGAFAFGDTIKMQTDVVLSAQINITAQGRGNGTLLLEGGGHAVTQNASVSRFLVVNDVSKAQFLVARNFSIAGFRNGTGVGHREVGGNSLVCMATESTYCFSNPETGSESQPIGPLAEMEIQYAPVVGYTFDNIGFFNNSAGTIISTQGNYDHSHALKINDCKFVNNIATTLILTVGVASVTESLIEENFIRGNLMVFLKRGHGPGLSYLAISQVKVWRNVFTHVSTDLGYLVHASSSYATIANSTFRRNPGSDRGISAYRLHLFGSLIQSPPPGKFGYAQLTSHSGLYVGESSLTTNSLEAFIIDNVPLWRMDSPASNRNPVHLNLTYSGTKAVGCGSVGVGWPPRHPPPPLACNPNSPCTDLYNAQGDLVGYKCHPLPHKN